MIADMYWQHDKGERVTECENEERRGRGGKRRRDLLHDHEAFKSVLEHREGEIGYPELSFEARTGANANLKSSRQRWISSFVTRKSWQAFCERDDRSAAPPVSRKSSWELTVL